MSTSRSSLYEEFGNLTGVRKYPNPFFDISRNYMPQSIKVLFPYCRIYYYRNEFLQSVIRKLVSYPITDIILEGFETLEDKKIWTTLFDEHLQLKNLLICTGLAYNVFGNAILSINLKFRRYLKCKACGHQTLLDTVTKRRFTNFTYRGICPECKKDSEYEIIDVPLKTPEAIKVIIWAPERLNIIYNEFTGESTYYYNIPVATKRAIREGKLEVIDEQPKIFIDAVKQSKKIKLDSSNVFHLKQPTLPEDDQGWGKPVILPAMGLIFYMQILRRGNEAVAWEHVVPLRILFPTPSANLDPLAQNNIGAWKAKVEEGIKKWKIDPNHIIIAPIPVGQQNIGGDAKALMVTQELRLLEELIINSLGIPIEFVKGGVSWTGTSVSLRIVENGFINYRSDVVRLLNTFIIPKISNILSIKGIHARLRRLKMQDDAETKQVYLNLNASGKISDTTLLDEMGIDPEVDNKRKIEDIDFDNSVKAKMAEGQVKVDSIISEGRARAQAGADWAYVDEKARIDEKLFEEEITNEQANNQTGIQQFDRSAAIHKWALELLTAPPKERDRVISEMQEKMPATAALVIRRAQLIQQNIMGFMSEEAGGPPPPRISKTKGEPHTAPKRGNL